MCKKFRKYLEAFAFVEKEKAEIEKVAESKIDEIKRVTDDVLKLTAKYAEKDKDRIKKLSEKMSASIDENDLTTFGAQIDEMLSILDEDKAELIKQEIADKKLKGANL